MSKFVYKRIENGLLEVCDKLRLIEIPIIGDILRFAAKEYKKSFISDFKASSGWIENLNKLFSSSFNQLYIYSLVRKKFVDLKSSDF